MKKSLLDALLQTGNQEAAGVTLCASQGAVEEPDALPYGTTPQNQTSSSGRSDGRIDMQQVAQQKGVCLTCARWQTDEFGDGLCPLGRRAHGWYDGNPTLAVITTAAHRCAAHGGAGWQAK